MRWLENKKWIARSDGVNCEASAKLYINNLQINMNFSNFVDGTFNYPQCRN